MRFSPNALLVVLLAGLLFSCQSQNKPGAPIEYVPAVTKGPAPPPPPHEFEFIKAESIHLPYLGKQIDFEVKLYTDRMYAWEGEMLQTYFVQARNDFDTDRFYFALPVTKNRFWNAMTIFKTNKNFKIGYSDSNRFVSLYTVGLDSNNLNGFRMYMWAENAQ